MQDELMKQLEDERCRRKLAEDELLRATAALQGIYTSKRWRLAGVLAKLMGGKSAPAEETLPWLGDGEALPTPDISPLITDGVYPPVTVPQWDKPTVSIVIPVYNQFAYTYRCVASIVANSGSVTYEILIADDCSTDETTDINRILPGVRHIRNRENLRFLLNCNHAASFAKGKYVLFLNNDTQVLPNWLEPLVRLIESAEDIGLVGSKLIYPDGRLQEAGGIVWRDGTAWNYGNKGNPTLPEFNYVKETDYISGAAIMLPRTLWERMGGFDEAFVPAYCEDSDLAFTVRSLGYKVMYQPLSEVIHFEGVSNGTDTSTGLKAYQVTNTKRFFEKWQTTLRNHALGGTCVFSAKDRSLGKETVVILADTPRQGAQRALSLAKAGCNVKLVPTNGAADTALQQQGIEVRYGKAAADGLDRWLTENAHLIDRTEDLRTKPLTKGD